MLTRKRPSVSKTWFKNVGIVTKLQNDAAIECLKHLLPIFKEVHTRAPRMNFFMESAALPVLKIRNSFLQTSTIDRMAEDCDLLIAIGGDGTILRCARYFLFKKGWRSNLLLGVNAGHLGFLTFLAAHEARKSITDALLMSARPRTEKRSCLKITVERNRKVYREFHVLNDAVLGKGSLSRIFELHVEIDKQFLSSYRSDGLIVSTPTGSTAYNLAAGGSILGPNVPAIQITPICPQSFSNKPIVVSDQQHIEIWTGRHSSDVFLTLDGHTGLRIEPGDRVKVEKSTKTVSFLLPPGMDWTHYYHSLRQKLKWGLVSSASK